MTRYVLAEETGGGEMMGRRPMVRRPQGQAMSTYDIRPVRRQGRCAVRRKTSVCRMLLVTLGPWNSLVNRNINTVGLNMVRKPILQFLLDARSRATATVCLSRYWSALVYSLTLTV